MKIDVVSRKLIKPQKPTPQNLNKLNLSFLDELSPAINVGVILFYPKPLISINVEQTLQESLSKVLTQFYPFAGRYIHKDHSVDCADQGAEWVEAEAGEAELTDVVAKTDIDQLQDLFPRRIYQVDFESPTDPLVSIQMTAFKCGGLAIGVSIWHRICDASSVGTFIRAWSNAATESSSPSIRPSFDLAELFPRNHSYMAEFGQRVTAGVDHRPTETIVAKRFLFNKEAIASVRSRYDLIKASRVRVVCAVITKALIEVERRKHGEKSRPCLGAQAVNMRGRTVPPAAEHACGNMITVSLTPYINKTEETDIQQLVDLFGEGLKKTIAELAEMLSPDSNRYAMSTTPAIDLARGVLTGEANIVFFTDWSKLGLYEADFGWGKAVGTGVGPLPHENSTLLMESEESGGLEAWVHLTARDMAYFEQDQEIQKLFTT